MMCCCSLFNFLKGIAWKSMFSSAPRCASPRFVPVRLVSRVRPFCLPFVTVDLFCRRAVRLTMYEEKCRGNLPNVGK